MQCFRRAAALLDLDLRILATDCAPMLSAACQVADESFRVPRCDDPAFPAAMIDVCRKHNVSLLIPTIDTELGALASNRGPFQDVGTLVAISHPDVVELARNKLTTARFLELNHIPSPRTFPLTPQSPLEEMRYPIIVKPVEGSSSLGTEIFQSADKALVSRHRTDCIVQEYWAGEEYTVNLFFDRERLRCAIPHLRLETRSGEVSKAITRRVAALDALAEQLGSLLQGRAFGALCFQAIIAGTGEVAVLELNARFGGGYPLADYAGATFAQWLLEISLERPCLAGNNWRENLQMLRYDAALFRQT